MMDYYSCHVFYFPFKWEVEGSEKKLFSEQVDLEHIPISSYSKRRNKVSQLLEKYGLRVNFCVFECMFTEAQLSSIQREIGTLIVTKEDTVIYYPCCMNCFSKIIYQPCRRIAGNVVLVK